MLSRRLSISDKDTLLPESNNSANIVGVFSVTLSGHSAPLVDIDGTVTQHSGPFI